MKNLISFEHEKVRSEMNGSEVSVFNQPPQDVSVFPHREPSHLSVSLGGLMSLEPDMPVRKGGGGSGVSGIVGVIKTPLGAVLIVVITLILASLSIASAVSGSLTAAAVSAAGLIVVVLIIALINLVGK